MKILIDRLESSPTPFAFDGGPDWWRLQVRGERTLPGALVESFRFEGVAYLMGEDIYLEGRLEGGVDLECGRCLARYRQRLREPFRLLLEPAGNRVPADPEGAEALAGDGLCIGDELESGWFRGSEIHLGAFLREVATVALPVQPLCREDCAGLCPGCGADRNKSTCSCAGTNSESPFAVLAALRK